MVAEDEDAEHSLARELKRQCKMRGIKNINANCFMNAALQALLNVGSYNNAIVKLYIDQPADHDNEMLKKYLRMLIEYHNPKSSVNDPLPIRNFLLEACARDKQQQKSTQSRWNS